MFAFTAIFKIIPPRVWAFLAILIALIFGVWYVIHGYTSQIRDLTKANVQLVAENTQLKEDVKTAVAANVTNMETITQLRNDKKNADDAKKQMEIQSKRDKQNIQTIMGAIDTAPESDNGKVAPVLKRTVDSIITYRKAREAVK
jgi:Na+-transporting methylmalonyl-CoA/oxaloacetate decarboxylase gamma subunit